MVNFIIRAQIDGERGKLVTPAKWQKSSFKNKLLQYLFPDYLHQYRS